mgnify:CR=1 FL=1
MQIQLINRTDPERILVNVLNGEASSLTTGFGVALAIGNEDVVASANGVTAVMFTNSAELRPGFIGVAKSDIAPNSYGPVISWGFADSIALSQEANVTVGLLAGASLLRAGAQAGTFTSALTPQAISTYCGKYVVNATTQSCTGGINYTKGLIRCI